MSREQFIQRAVDNGFSSNEINRGLQSLGYDKLNKIQSQQVDEGTYGQNFLQRAKGDVVDLGKGISTILGMAYQGITHPRSEGLPLLKQGAEYLASSPSITKDFINLVASPYNTSVEKALTQSPVETLTDIGAGIVNHPVYAAMDTLPLLGDIPAKGISKASKLLPEDSALRRTVKGWVDPKGRTVNQILSTSKDIPADVIENLNTRGFNLQQAKVEDLAQAFKNLENPVKGKWTGTEAQLQLTKELRDFVKDTDSLRVKAGYNEGAIKDSAVSQYVTRRYQELGKEVPVAEVERAIKSDKVAKELGLDKTELDKIVQEGSKLYDEGFIYPLKHNTTSQTVREGLVEEGTKKQRSATAKLYGTQDYTDLAQGFKDTGYGSVINKLGATESAMTAIDNIVSTVGKKVDSLENLKLGTNEVVVSPKLLNEKFGTSLVNNEGISGDIQSLTRGLNKAEMKKYADNLYVLNKDDLTAFQNAFTPSASGVLDTLSGIAKTGALATPRYVVGNMLTNALLSPITGANLVDTASILKNKDLIPEALKRSATYSGYLGSKLPLRASMKEVYTELAKELKEGTPLEKLQALNMMGNYPIFRSSQSLETLQRSTEYLNQAKQYAKEVGKTTEEILKEAKAQNGNNATFRELLNRTQRYLGDYTGTNYYAPQKLQQAASLITPFYRPITQGFRQMYNALKDYPIETQAFYRLPARAGADISKRLEEEYNVAPYKSYGGYPVMLPQGKMPARVMYNQYHAFSPVSEFFENPTNVLSGNTFAGSLLLPLMGKNRYGDEILPPNSYKINGQIYSVDNNGNIINRDKNNPIDYLRNIMGQYSQSFISPINQLNNYILPNIALLTRQEFKRPADTSILGQIGDLKLPMLMEGASTRGRKGAEEILAPQLSFNITDSYPERGEAIMLRDQKGLRKIIRRRQAKNERR